jgi:SPX domain protein involved in polyphosphate accumulation
MARIDECEKVISKIFKSGGHDQDPRLKPAKEEMSRITSDITDLSRYMRLNYSGFIKVSFIILINLRF